ncbi:MAG TPA: diacylglycerol kinase family protein [Thermoanaerobaculia bacterium]|nr:diacylglycerol kinase family protein [Thermoanaerobaculia bacterium]
MLVNRGSGTVKKKRLTVEGLREMFQKAGIEADVRLIPGGEIVDAARAAVKAGTEAVVAGGGDGTVRGVASVLAGGEVPLGVLPLGTLNHFATDLKIPSDLEAAVRLIAEGEVRALDVGEVNGEIFLNNSSLGFYPPIVQARDQEMRRSRHGKWVAMAIATFKLLPRLSSLRVKISSGDWQVERRTEVLFVGTSEYQMSLLSHGAPDRLESDGQLYVYLSRSRSRLGLIGLALAGLVRDVKQTRMVEDWRLRELKVEVRKKRAIPVAFDGEVSTMKSPLLYRKRPQDLRVILPPQAPA